MFMHNKRLQYTVRVDETNPALANLMLEQFGGPQGELAAAMPLLHPVPRRGRSRSQGHADRHRDRGAEPSRGHRHDRRDAQQGRQGPQSQKASTARRRCTARRTPDGNSHTHAGAVRRRPAADQLGRRAVDGGYIDTIGDPSCDLRSNIAAEARAKIVYERLINLTDDPGVKEALGFLMTREIAHQQSFEKALYSIQPTSRRASCRASARSPTCTSTPRKATAT